MKYKLNMQGPGLIMFRIICITTGIAIVLFLLNIIIAALIFGCIAFGLLLILLILVKVELYQDDKLIKKYHSSKSTPVNISDTVQECESCGARTSQRADFCPACGQSFKIFKS